MTSFRDFDTYIDMRKVPPFPYQDESLPNLPANFFITLYLPYETFVSILETEFKLKFESETIREYEVTILHDLGPNTLECSKFTVLRFHSMVDHNHIEFAYEVGQKPSSLTILKNNSDFVRKILKRFQFYNLALCYTLPSQMKLSDGLKDLYNDFKIDNIGYEWLIRNNSRAKEILIGRSQNIPEFISIDIDEYLYVSFLFPEQEEQSLTAKSYSDFCKVSYNTEHSVPSIRNEAHEKIDQIFSEVLQLSPVMLVLHEFLIKRGFKIKTGRIQKEWHF
jgi:hypothetical protein